MLAISKENKEFVENLIDYYISESEAYKEIAENYSQHIESINDITFGIIVGCVYSSFLQIYQRQQQSPSLEEVKEFHQILNEKAQSIKKSILSPNSAKIKESQKSE